MTRWPLGNKAPVLVPPAEMTIFAWRYKLEAREKRNLIYSSRITRVDILLLHLLLIWVHWKCHFFSLSFSESVSLWFCTNFSNKEKWKPREGSKPWSSLFHCLFRVESYLFQEFLKVIVWMLGSGFNLKWVTVSNLLRCTKHWLSYGLPYCKSVMQL